MSVQLQCLLDVYAFTSRPADSNIGGSSRLALLFLHVVLPRALSKQNFSRIEALYVTTQARGI
jgi:hypothetical protein